LHKDALLADGRVLVVGGSGLTAFMPNADIFDPAANGGLGAWSATAPLTTGRSNHTATRLLDGRVLVVGGIKNGSSTGYLNSAQIFDPAANGGLGGWTDTGSMGKARKDHTATLLPDGRVLVAGGFNMTDFTMRYAEIFDPAAGGGVGAWSATGPLGTGRYSHTATRLADGKVLVAGGYVSGGASPTSCELYDPATGIWSATDALDNGRRIHTATRLLDGRVLAAGGEVGGTAMTSAELFTSVQANLSPLFLLLGD
jgi:phosphatidylserine/phosphatidylglycerophosphate/cardiolipin synthase-like enzyme